jgi:IS30 family transposase
MVPLQERPSEADDRAVAGHWEGDLVMGRRPSAVATLVERTTRYTVLVALPAGLKADAVHPAVRDALNRVPPYLRRSLVWDRGREMAAHAQLTADTGCPVYFCEPKSPWQRGTNENTNRLLRQYLPRAEDFRHRSQAALDELAAQRAPPARARLANTPPRPTPQPLTPSRGARRSSAACLSFTDMPKTGQGGGG